MTDRWHIAVLIPAKNEEDLLPRCLQSVMAACSAVAPYASTDIILVVDDSEDDTLSIASEMIGDNGLVLKRNFSCVGMARHEAAQVAMQRASSTMNRCWLANTDADCLVPPDWLAKQLVHAVDEYAGVVGIVDVDSFREHQCHVARRFCETYVLHSDGTHPHVHGANIGFQAEAYLSVGGWAALSTAEDHDLWGRFQVAGHKLTSDTSIKVVTSGRREGRAPMGFAAALAAHNEVGI